LNYPKILFININFRDDNSAGITISKLVDHIPKEKLFLLSNNAINANINIFNEKKQLDNPPSVMKMRRKKKSLLRRCFVNTIGQKRIFNKFELTEEIKKWLDEIKPDFIYFCPDSLANIKFSDQIAKYCNAKIIIHIMDDKVNVRFPGIIGLLYKTRFRKAFKQIVKRASIRLSISDLMAEEYERRYGEKFVAFHNPVDIEKWIPFQKKDFTNKKEITIIYSGWVGSTSQPILEFCDIISSINVNLMNINFVLYAKFSSDEVKHKISSYDFVEINDYVSQEKLPATISKADFLFLPLSFDKKMKFVNLSMPTKTAEYMSSGVPIIVYAPKDTALSQYAKKYEWGYTITKNDKGIIKEKLLHFFYDTELQQKLSKNALDLLGERHDVIKNKKRFDKLIMR
jgi:glycosyltransferase involved in cell wall biosynthesis